MASTVLIADRIITGDDDIEHGWVQIEGDRIAAVGQGDLPSGHVEVIDGWLVPGFVDIHVHGGAGSSFSQGDVDAVVAFHRRHGTTTMLASLVSEPVPNLVAQLHALRPFVESGTLAGVHLEGPFLASARCGAHDPAALSAPTTDALDALLEAGGDIIRMVTLAPELPGALEAVSRLDDLGIVVALGHSDADADAAHFAVNAGASVVTHLFNGMRPWNQRNAGLVDVALLDSRIIGELILDGHHLSDHAAELAMRTLDERWIAITDVVSAAGVPDGTFRLGDLEIEARSGVVRVLETGALAGSTLTMDRAFARILDQHARSPLEAVRATATRPAGVLQRRNVGRIQVGATADFVHWNDGALQRVMHRGQWDR